MFHRKAAGHAAGVQKLRPFRDQGQAGVALFPGYPALPQTAPDAVQQTVMDHQAPIQGQSRRGQGDIVFSGPQTAGNDDKLRPAQPLLQDFPDQRGLVAHRGNALHHQTGLEKPAGGITGVAVGYLAGEQLRAGGDDFALHHRAVSRQQLAVS